MRFSGKTAIITGGASGIGAATSRRLHGEGANLVIADINDEAAGALISELGEDRAFYQHTDVTDYEAMAALVDAAEDKFGPLGVFINNVGMGCLAKTPDLDNDMWKRVIDVSLNSVFYGCKVAIQAMRKAGGGAIVNVASASGLGGDYGFTAYNAAKAGVVNYTKAAAIDHARENIRINGVCPGLIATPMSGGIWNNKKVSADWFETIPIGRPGTPEEVAAVCTFLASEEASFMIGSIVSVDGGVMASTGQPDATKLFGTSG